MTRTTILQRYFQYHVGQVVMAGVSKVHNGHHIDRGTRFTIAAFPLKGSLLFLGDRDPKGQQYKRFVVGFTEQQQCIALLMSEVYTDTVTHTSKTSNMKLTIECSDQYILVEWQGRLKAGTIVRVHTGDPGLAMNIIPLLLDQKNKRNLWYQSAWTGNAVCQDMVLCKGKPENWEGWDRTSVISQPKHIVQQKGVRGKVTF